MPFKSKAQQRYLESSASPLTAGQKKEFESATDFSKLPEKVGDAKKMDHSKKHPGFKSVQAHIAAQEGLSEKAAGAILASRSRGASKSAKKANPRLNRVKG